MRTDQFNKRIVTQTTNHFKRDAETTKRNRKHTKSTYNGYKRTKKHVLERKKSVRTINKTKITKLDIPFRMTS